MSYDYNRKLGNFKKFGYYFESATEDIQMSVGEANILISGLREILKGELRWMKVSESEEISDREYSGSICFTPMGGIFRTAGINFNVPKDNSYSSNVSVSLYHSEHNKRRLLRIYDKVMGLDFQHSDNAKRIEEEVEKLRNNDPSAYTLLDKLLR